jgi:hypothetical protein
MIIRIKMTICIDRRRMRGQLRGPRKPDAPDLTMKRNEPIVMRREGDASAAAEVATQDRPAAPPDFAHGRILAFVRKNARGVGVRKDRHGYTLFREDTGEPVARLRPRGGLMFAVLYWSRFRQKWRPIGEFGDMILRLDDALAFIAADPMGCFWL